MNNNLKKFISLVLEQQEELSSVSIAQDLFNKIKMEFPTSVIQDDSNNIINSAEEITDQSRVFFGGQDPQRQNFSFTIKSSKELEDKLGINDYLAIVSYNPSSKLFDFEIISDEEVIDGVYGQGSSIREALSNLKFKLDKKRYGDIPQERDPKEDYYEVLADQQKWNKEYGY